MINDRDLLHATVQRKREERLFYYTDFAGECIDKVLKHYQGSEIKQLKKDLGFFVPSYVSPRRKPDAPKFDYSEYYTDIEIPEGVKIDDNGVLNLPGSTFHFTHTISPLRDIFEFEDVLKLPIYKKPEYYDFSGLEEKVKNIQKDGSVACAWVGRLFEDSWPLRGYENMLADMIVEPEIAEYFLDNEFNWDIEYAINAAKAGVDLLYFGDDVGNQNGMTFSADLWRKMLKPKWDKIFSAAKKVNPNIVIWYHSCGDVTEIVGDLIDVGVNILNPIQPECMDIYNIHKKYGDKISFDGGLGTQKLMPFGTPDQVAAEVKNLIDVFGKNGGFVLSPSHILEPEVPIENIDAFIKTAQKEIIL